MREIKDFESAIETGLYRHYKGKTYTVYGSVIHSETEGTLVLYAPLDGDGAINLWVRPLEMFCETVSTPEGLVPRFIRIN
jgi:hypothetical protein